jgi:hypothetical protein
MQRIAIGTRKPIGSEFLKVFQVQLDYHWFYSVFSEQSGYSTTRRNVANDDSPVFRGPNGIKCSADLLTG